MLQDWQVIPFHQHWNQKQNGDHSNHKHNRNDSLEQRLRAIDFDNPDIHSANG